MLSVFTYACESDLLYAFWCPIDLYGREYESPKYASVVPKDTNGYFIEQDKLALHNPEIYVIEYPYNGYNKATDIPHQFYTGNLKASGAQVVYIPYFSCAAGDATRGAEGLKNVDVIFHGCGVQHSIAVIKFIDELEEKLAIFGFKRSDHGYNLLC